ncbi:hypothetical protein [Lysinibacillus fusiformis]|uniref:hypothetical protein n=1 Tax=Lysinibacillus fusiformis TaxID=28031 RepID=UPI001F071008|nr:hypothetical protein [Lysinibacillus fusiformis]
MKNQKKDVELTRQIHEMEAIRVISCTVTLRTLPMWDSFFVKLEIELRLIVWMFYEK